MGVSHGRDARTHLHTCAAVYPRVVFISFGFCNQGREIFGRWLFGIFAGKVRYMPVLYITVGTRVGDKGVGDDGVHA